MENNALVGELGHGTRANIIFVRSHRTVTNILREKANGMSEMSYQKSERSPFLYEMRNKAGEEMSQVRCGISRGSGILHEMR